MAGDRIEVSGHVGADRDAGGSVEFHGDGGEVIGANPHYRHAKTDEPMTTVRTDDGSVVAIPTRALRRG